MDFPALMKQAADILVLLGIAPNLLGLGIVLAVLLRFARASFLWFGRGWTYAAAFVFGLLGATIVQDGTLVFGQGLLRGLVRDTTSLSFIVLLLQGGLQMLAKKIAWLPQDNQFVNPSATPPPTP
jgi:hypothetical protein